MIDIILRADQYSNELYTFTIHFGTLPRWSRMGGKKRKIPFNWVKQVKVGWLGLVGSIPLLSAFSLFLLSPFESSEG